jgi:autotransporter translocation and assembly factor TamB
MRTFLNKTVRIFLITLASLVCLLILLFLIAGSSIGEDFIKDIIEKNLSKTLNMTVSVEELYTNVLSHLEIREITISDDFSNEMSSLSIASLEVKYNIFGLLSNKLSISDILIQGLDVNLIRDKEGKFLLPVLPPAKEPPKHPMQIAIGNIEITGSSISYDDQSLPLETKLHGLMLTIHNDEALKKYTFLMQFLDCEIVHNEQVYDIEKFLVEGSYEEEFLKVSDISLSSKGINCSGNANAHLTEADTTFQAHLTIDGDPSQYINIFGDQLPANLKPHIQSVVAEISLEGSPAQPNIVASLTIPTIQAEEVVLNNTMLEVTMRNDTLRLKGFSAEFFDGSLTAEGWMMMDSTQSYNAELNISDLDFTSLWDFLYDDTSPYTGSVGGTIHSGGAVSTLLSSQISGNVQLGSIIYKTKSINPLNCTFSYKDGVAGLDVTQGTSSIKSNFTLQDSELSGSAQIDINNIEYIAGLFNLLDAKGMLQADAQFAGKVTNPDIKAKVKGIGLSYMNFPVDSLEAEIQYADSSLVIKTISFEGKIDSLSPVAKNFMNEEVNGEVRYNGAMSGTLEDFSGSIALHADRVTYQEFSVPSLDFECTAKNSDITVTKLHIATEKIRCEALGNFSLTERSGALSVDFKKKEKSDKDNLGSIESTISLAEDISFNASLKELSLEMLGAVSDSLSGIQGNVSGNLSFNGSMEKPNGMIVLTIDKTAYKDIYVENISIQGKLTPTEFILSSGIIQIFNNEIRFRGKLGLDQINDQIAISPHSSIEGEIALTEVKLSDFTEELLDAVQAKGTLTSTININGTVSNPVVNGSLRVKNGFVQLDAHKSTVEELNAVVIFSDSTLNINKFTGLYKGKTFSLTGDISQGEWTSFSPDIALSVNGLQTINIRGKIQKEEIDLHISLDDFDIAFTETFSPAIMNAQGHVNASVNIVGSMEFPKFRGWLKAANIEILPTDIPVPLSKCTLDISATDERMNLTTFECMFGEGSIKSSGYVAYNNGTINDIAFHIDAENISLKEPKKFQFVVKSCVLDYTQKNNNYLIDGNVVLGKTKYLEDVQISKVLDSINKPKIFRKPTPLMMQTKLRIRITESKDIWVDNNLARMRMKADLSVIGTLAQPNLTGRLEIAEGYIVYLDRKFEITRGLFDFTNPHMINPILDIQAEADIKNYQQPDADPYHIIFVITGPADKAKISLKSVPALDEANILSLLTFGTTREQLFSQSPDKYNTSLKDILLERAEQYSSQKITGFVASRLSNILDLDNVSIEGNLFNFGDSWGPQLVASKQLSKRMMVTYSTRIGYLNEQSIELDYKLTDKFYLQGQADQDGNAGLDIIYRVNFK